VADPPARRTEYAPLESSGALASERSVRLVGPDGTYDVPVSQASRARAEGWRDETPEEAAARDTRQRIESDPLIRAGAGAAAVLRGATLGLSDLGLAATAPGTMGEGARAVEGMREAAPGLSMGAEVVGALAPALLTGGASGAASGASLGARAAAAAGRAAAFGAAEGAVYGGAQGVLRELGDERLTSDPSGSAARILADVGLYGVLGGALGGALGGGARLAGDALSGTGRRAAGALADEAAPSGGVRGWLADVADEQARISVAGRAGREMDRGVGARLMREGVDVTDPERAVGQLKKLADEAEGRMTAAVQASDGRVSLGSLRKVADDLVAEMDPAVVPLDVAKAIKRAAAPIDDLAKAVSKGGDDTISLSRMAVLSREMRTRAVELQSRGKYSREAKEAIYSLSERFDDAIGDALDAAAAKAPGASDGHAPPARPLDFDRAAYATAVPTGGAAYREARRDMALFVGAKKAAEKFAEYTAQRGAGNILSRTLDSGMGAASVMGALVSGNPLALAGMALPAAQRILRERGAGIAAHLAHVASRGELRIGQLADRMLGKPALAIQRVTRSAADAGEGVARGAARAASDWSERYTRAAAPALAVRDDPRGAQERLAEGLSDVAEVYPELATELAAQTTAGLAALATRLPASVARPSLTPAATAAVMSPEALRDFVRAAEAMTDPDAALDAIEAGNASWLDLQALREGQPQMWAEIRSALIERVTELREELPFERRVTIGLAFDLAGADYSLDPVAGAGLQAAQAPTAEEQQPPPRRQSGPTQSARLAGQLVLQGDRAAQRAGGRSSGSA